MVAETGRKTARKARLARNHTERIKEESRMKLRSTTSSIPKKRRGGRAWRQEKKGGRRFMPEASSCMKEKGGAIAEMWGHGEHNISRCERLD